MEQAVQPWPDHLLDCEITQITWAAFHGRLPLNLPEEEKLDVVEHPANRQP